MWGVCLGSNICNGNLFQRIIEYDINTDIQKAIILQPYKDISISIDKIKPIEKPPDFIYGDIVSPINHFDVVGKIETIIWHFKNNDFNFYISVDGKMKSKRYYANDLIKR